MGVKEDLLQRASTLASMPLEQACMQWLEGRGTDISPKTRYEYLLNIKTFSKFFIGLRLPEIDADLLKLYQDHRREQGVGPPGINHECGLIVKIRKDMLMPIIGYRPLHIKEKEIGTALTDDQQRRLFRVAQEDQNWMSAYLFARISLNTSAGPKETFNIQLKDLRYDLSPPAVIINGTKNFARRRTVPITPECQTALGLALHRAQKLGSVDGDHYLFPRRLPNGRYDPTRPQITCKTAWIKLTRAAMLEGIRMYDLRHTFITEMLEDGRVSEKTIEDIVGHIKASTKRKYSHFRLEAKAAALEAMTHRRQAKPYLVKPQPRKEEAAVESSDFKKEMAKEMASIFREMIVAMKQNA